MHRRDQAESNEYRLYYATQENVTVMRMQFRDRYLSGIPADARRGFLTRVRDAYNAYETIEDAVEFVGRVRAIITAAQRASRTEGGNASAEILTDAIV